MDQKHEQLNIDLPSYSPYPNLTEIRRNWLVGITLGMFLVITIVGVTIIGIYMTQGHTEKMVTMVYNSKDGEKVSQTVSVNERENLAAVYVNTNKYSATMLYDYKWNIIGFRKPNSTVCYVMKMDVSRTPPISSILRGIHYFQSHNTPIDDTIIYSFIPGEEANPIDLGINVNILCSDATIYWAKMVNPEHGKRTLPPWIIPTLPS